jgi:hypothetical protein
MSRRVLVLLVAACCAMAGTVQAHVGSPDVYVDGVAGPYRLFVTIRPPYAVPGVAEIDVRIPTTGVEHVSVVPLPLTGPGAALPPVADAAARSAEDPQLFTTTLWIMTAGSWQVRITVNGAGGVGTFAVPVDALPRATRDMSIGLGVLLTGLMVLLCAAIVSIAAAAFREGSLEAGAVIDRTARRRGRIAGVVAAAVLLLALALGNSWWGLEASSYARYVYKPLEMTTAVDRGVLRLALEDPGWIRTRGVDDLVPDHGHLMHLFVLSPSLDRLWHLHPNRSEPAAFVHTLPSMPAGRYELFADVVHAAGVAETVTHTLDVPTIDGMPLQGDDSAWVDASGGNRHDGDVALLADGTRMVWAGDAQPLASRRLTLFTFRVEHADGRPVEDLQLYMGMPAHALVVRRDRGVFAHIHPGGSAAMAALDLAARSLSDGAPGAANATGHAEHRGGIPPVITFPYGLPTPGEYRIFVQVKRADRILTGAFDTVAR